MNKTHKSKSSSISSQIDRNNVKVVVRVRPFSDKGKRSIDIGNFHFVACANFFLTGSLLFSLERGKHDVQKALDVIDDQVIVQMTHGTGTPELLLGSPQSKHKQTRSFRYDHCYMSNNHSNLPVARANIRRHQSGRHQSAGMLLHRRNIEEDDEVSRLPRRPAWNGNHLGRSPAERGGTRGQAA